MPAAVATDIRGFIFDLDGVLTDTAEYHYQGWKRLCEDEGFVFDRAMGDRLRGVGRTDALQILLAGRRVRPLRFQELLDRKNRYYLRCVQGITPTDLLPGSRSLLAEIRKAGLKVAVASASKNARRVIRLLRIHSMLDAVTDGNSVERTKPAPDLFLHAAGQLGLSPEQCVVVEDAEAGVQAAHAAGMRCIGLGPHDRVGGADMVMPDLSRACLSGLVSALSRAGEGVLEPAS